VPDSRDAPAPCPDLADLLLASEGELPKRRQAEVTAHLRQCAACRDQLGGVGLALREYQDATGASDATSRASEADASAERLDVFRDRLQDERRTQSANRVRLPFRQWLPVAAAVPVLVGALFFSNRYTSVVRAEELLTKAAAQEQLIPSGTVRRLQIHIKRTGVRTTRDVGSAANLVPVGQNPEDADLTRRLEASHLDPRDPLSVRAFRGWHDSLRSKTDSVSPVDGDALALHTETDDGVLHSVELIVRRVDFQPVRATFAFTDLGEVEIVELSRWIAPAPVIVEHAEPGVPVAKPAAPANAALEDAELDIRTALHRTGADWKSSVAVTRAGSVIEVRGHVDAEQRAQIASAVDRIEFAKLVLRTANDAAAAVSLADPVPPGREPVANEATAAPDVPMVPLQRWLERTFGRSERASNFVPVLTANAEQVRRRETRGAGRCAVSRPRGRGRRSRRSSGVVPRNQHSPGRRPVIAASVAVMRALAAGARRPSRPADSRRSARTRPTAADRCRAWTCRTADSVESAAGNRRLLAATSDRAELLEIASRS
jgi:hypothetical protein